MLLTHCPQPQLYFAESRELLRFLMRRVLPAALAKLRELQTASGRLLVLRRRVIALLALGTLQRDDFPHCVSLNPLRSSKPRAGRTG